MIDYWSLIHALEMKSKMDCSIRYVGIDIIDWNYKIPQRQNDEVHYLIGNAADIFTIIVNLSPMCIFSQSQLASSLIVN